MTASERILPWKSSLEVFFGKTVRVFGFFDCSSQSRAGLVTVAPSKVTTPPPLPVERSVCSLKRCNLRSGN